MENNILRLCKGAVRAEREYADFLAGFAKYKNGRKDRMTLVSGLCEGAVETFAAAFSEDTRLRTLILTPDEKSAERFASAMAQFKPGEKAVFYPSRDFIFEDIEASNVFEVMRMRALSDIADGNFGCVVSTVPAALQLTVPKEKLREYTLTIEIGKRLQQREFIAKLAEMGYRRCDMVEGVSGFSVRGDIVDIFPPSEKNPVRIEFFGDEIDAMGAFDVLSQRRIENIKSCKILPVTEVMISGDSLPLLKEIASKLMKSNSPDNKTENMLAREYDALVSDGNFRSKDRYISAVYDKKECLFDYFGDDTVILLINSNAVDESLAAHNKIYTETIREMLEKGRMSGEYAVYEKSADDYSIYLQKFSAVAVNSFSGRGGFGEVYDFTSRQSPLISANFESFCDDLKYYGKNGYRILIAQNSDAGIKSLKSTLDDMNFTAITEKSYADLSDLPESAAVLMKNEITAEEISLGGNGRSVEFIRGFELPQSKFVYVAESRTQEIKRRGINPLGGERGRAYGRNQKKYKAGKKITAFTDLSAGDPVVHVNYGIGVFLGIVRQEVHSDDKPSGGYIRKDFIKIKYAGSDVLYVPCTQLDLVSKYIGGDADHVKLSKMGGAEWHKAKARAKSAAKDIARELIKLYAARRMRKGHAFPADTEWQRDFEGVFEYEETDDQLLCAEEIKEDMEKAVPMDRLLCGDVGFGKTEVALRAAFKCVSDSKQTAILVPTTILAWQHYKTIASRFREFPVRCEYLSRFKSPREQKEILRKLERGEIDIIVGTHMLLQNSIKFKDLGLLIVDEEQRFGVSHKEKLKQLAGSVDVLTLTATPIPRTLNMALSGIRDMSLIEEAPQDRLPVQTYILEHDDGIVAEAISRELKRNGQVFYLHNRVDSIFTTADKISKLVPEARIGIGHGKMPQEELSEVWRQMIEGEIDVLVCTTIIETGVDVPNANTLIIENADRMGLAQLHQIRGRVGRSNRKAYAYLTYQGGKALSEIAEKRLTSIREYSEFGSGFKIAMRDLEIRGAGNLLGAEQHGQMEAVGYDLYVKILEQAVREERKKIDAGIDGEVETEIAKAEAETEQTDCSVDVAIDAYIPNKYIESELTRIDVYKKIAAVESSDDADDLIDELSDRFGEVPQTVLNLIEIAKIRRLAGKNLFEAIENKDRRNLVLKSSALSSDSGKDLLARITIASSVMKGRVLLTMSDKPYVTLLLAKGESMLELLNQFFAALDARG